MYSSSQPRLLHWYLYMAPLWLSIGSLSLGETRRFLMVLLNQYKRLVSRFPSDLMKSTVVDESLSSFKPMYCSREYRTSTRVTDTAPYDANVVAVLLLMYMMYAHLPPLSRTPAHG